ncbi:MAG: biotin--[acetyl-CoA-carboxylase] ligase [Candidatus Rokuibacteriota bacterium]|nr:MAG: biotin--[acetyl-CoA-carboxylase] ligase [Candidatus Rokubacteria bacterium]
MIQAAAKRLGHTIHRFAVLDSTQVEAARCAAAGAAEGTVVTTVHQSAGRGRRGRVWLDAPGESLLMSVILRPPIAAALAPQLSLVSAIAVVDALHEVAGIQGEIRWPNDVLLDGRKVSGILAEALSDAAGRLAHVILGVGVNVNQLVFPGELGQGATSLRLATERPHEVAGVLAALLDALQERYAAGDGREGLAVDLAPDGALVIRLDDGAMVRVVAGEVTTEADRAPAH